MDQNLRGHSARVALLLTTIGAALGQSAQTEKARGARVDPAPVTLSMKWARGDRKYGPNFILLSAPCQTSGHALCECTMQFKVMNSPEFADYISSFGDALVPVIYGVSYGPEGLVQGAGLESVGTWQVDRFQVSDRLLGIRYSFTAGGSGEKQKVNLRSPADCFPPKGN